MILQPAQSAPLAPKSQYDTMSEHDGRSRLVACVFAFRPSFHYPHAIAIVRGPSHSKEKCLSPPVKVPFVRILETNSGILEKKLVQTHNFACKGRKIVIKERNELAKANKIRIKTT